MRGNKTVTTAAGGGQPLGEAVCGRCARGKGARGVEGTRATTRDGQLAPPHELLKRVQHIHQNGWLCWWRWKAVGRRSR